MILFENEYFALIDNGKILEIKTKKTGFDIKEFNKITLLAPTIHITNFNALKNALHEPSEQAVAIGILKPEIEVHLSPDKMEGRIMINITADRFEKDRPGYTAKIASLLKENNIIYGLENIYEKPLSVQREIIVAKGTPPIDGADSEIHLYEVKEKKPKIEDDGKVNHYELSLIESVNKGDWVGEMTPPTEGTPGKTVTGETLEPKPGKIKKLLFDSKTVRAVEEDGKTVLRALVDGAIRIDNGKVKIDNLLMIKGDVDYVTGNIHFAGSVAIQGTVQDNFSVIANGDISINSPLGVGSANRIESVYGSVYIKGGIYGKGITKVKAGKDIFLKYCNEADIEAAENIQIGFYSLDSTLAAQNILLDPTHGRLIGGTATAKAHVTSGVIGNKSERTTTIIITGFDREKLSKELEELAVIYADFRKSTAYIRLQIDTYEKSGANLSGNKEYAEAREHYEANIRELIRMEHQQKQMIQMLSVKGEGELNVTKTIFPKTHILIKQIQKLFEEPFCGTLYYKSGELVEENRV